MATIVAAHGSTYRKPGARMLMTERSWLAGAISGGCLEGDLLRKAWWRTDRTPAVIVTYDGAAGHDEDEEAQRIGFGLGCDGSIDVLVERITAGEPVHPLRALATALRERKPLVISTVISVASDTNSSARPHVGQRAIASLGRPLLSNIAQPFAQQVATGASRILDEGTRQTVASTARAQYSDGKTQIAVVHELVLPAPRLVIFGSNYDVLPLARLAHELGWDVILVARKAPLAAGNASLHRVARLVLGRVPQILPELGLCPRTSVVVMTHNYEHDQAILRALGKTELAYLGVLGPARRTRRMLDELAAAGTPMPRAMLARLHSPVGLDLGAAEPEEVALSIIAEIKAETAARSARPLRELSERRAAASEFIQLSTRGF
jgi:xanthine/CO dehydrogenase XdhC/CoxF family maturation factor